MELADSREDVIPIIITEFLAWTLKVNLSFQQIIVNCGIDLLRGDVNTFEETCDVNPVSGERIEIFILEALFYNITFKKLTPELVVAYEYFKVLLWEFETF